MQIYPNRKTQIVSTTVVKLSSLINCKFLFRRLKVSKIVVRQKYKVDKFTKNISNLLHCYTIYILCYHFYISNLRFNNRHFYIGASCHIREKAYAYYWSYVVKSLLLFSNVFKMLILTTSPLYFSVRHHHTTFSQKWGTQRHFGPINSRLMLQNRPAIHFLIST